MGPTSSEVSMQSHNHESVMRTAERAYRELWERWQGGQERIHPACRKVPDYKPGELWSGKEDAAEFTSATRKGKAPAIFGRLPAGRSDRDSSPDMG